MVGSLHKKKKIVPMTAQNQKIVRKLLKTISDKDYKIVVESLVGDTSLT